MTRSIKALRVFIIAGFALVSVANVAGSDIKVIANSSVTTDFISAGELKRIYLLQTRKMKDGSVVEPVLQKRGAVHDTFCTQFLDRDGEEIRTYYHGVVFTGKGSMPREVNSDEEKDFLCRAHSRRDRICEWRRQYRRRESAVRGSRVRQRPKNSAETSGTRISQRTANTGDRGYGTPVAHGVSKRIGSVPTGDRVENPILAEAAEKAVREWVYSPSATSSTIEVSIPFAVRP